MKMNKRTSKKSHQLVSNSVYSYLLLKPMLEVYHNLALILATLELLPKASNGHWQRAVWSLAIKNKLFILLCCQKVSNKKHMNLLLKMGAPTAQQPVSIAKISAKST